MREIVLDTETTGLDPSTGDRIVEIGAVEVLNAIPSGNVFHVYLNPERTMPAEAFAVHGLSDAFLSDKPLFADVADDVCAFLGADKLVAHNASFDVAFLNHELKLCGRPAIPACQVVDTLALAKRKHIGANNSLDGLCSRYGVDRSRRVKHGALLDAELLAEVYLELCGGRQATFALRAEDYGEAGGAAGHKPIPPRPMPLAPRLTAENIAAHEAYMATFTDSIWARIWAADAERATRQAAE